MYIKPRGFQSLMAWSIGIAKIIIIKGIVAPKIRHKKFQYFEKLAPDLEAAQNMVEYMCWAE